jgi:hypothetical protein
MGPIPDARSVFRLQLAKGADGSQNWARIGPIWGMPDSVHQRWFRIIQPDTLTLGTLPALTCTVADRFGLPSAVFIECFNSAGARTNTSFTVSVSR